MAGLGLDTTSDIIPQERKKKTRFETAQVAIADRDDRLLHL